MTKSAKQYIQEITSKGGKARAKKLTAEQRREIARKGGLQKGKNAKARRAKAKKEGDGT